jgi:hypothetical protein
MKTLTLSQTSLDRQLLNKGDQEVGVVMQSVRKVLLGMIM